MTTKLKTLKEVKAAADRQEQIETLKVVKAAADRVMKQIAEAPGFKQLMLEQLFERVAGLEDSASCHARQNGKVVTLVAGLKHRLDELENDFGSLVTYMGETVCPHVDPEWSKRGKK